MWKYRYIVFILLLLVFAIGCSGAGSVSEPPGPSTGDTVPVNSVAAGGATSIAGLWQVTIDRGTGTIGAVDLRSGSFIINVLGFLEPPAHKGLTIDFTTLEIHPGTNIVNVDVILKHPLNDPMFMGFDVRGVVFGPEVTNADGYMVVLSPEYFTGVPFGYKDGLLGTPDSVANYEGLAGYKYFCKDLGLNDSLATFMSNPANLANRGVFPNGTTLIRHYDLSLADTTPPITFLVFNYAVYANYNWPTGAAPYDISDFDINTANSAEAFCIKVEETANTLWYSGGSGGGAISLKAEIWDWQGDIADVGMHFYWTAGAFPHDSHFTLTGPGATSHSYIYEAKDIPFTPTATGPLDITITAIDSKTFGNCWILGLLPAGNTLYYDPLYVCRRYKTTVGPCPAPIVSAINPNNHFPDGIQFPATITGSSFVPGPSLAVALTRTGQSDINAVNAQVTSPTQITCNITIPPGTATGYWNVRVTNGCATQGTGINLFTVLSGESGPKNIELRGTKYYAWDLSVEPKTGDLFIFYSDLQVWKYPASDYTKGEMYSDVKNVLVPEIPDNGWIECSPNYYTIVGYDNSKAVEPPYAGWVHIQPDGKCICGQMSNKFHAFADVMAADADGDYPLDHFGFFGIATNPWESHIYRMDDEPPPPSPCPYAYDPPMVIPEYVWSYPSAYYDKDSLMVSLVRGLEWDKEGNSFWAIKSGGNDSAYAARFKLEKDEIIYDDAYFGIGKQPEPGDDNGFYNPYDLTRDIKNRYLVVDVLPGWALRLKAWDVTTNPGTSLGGIDLTGLKGSPNNKSYRLRFDCDDNDHPKYGNILFVMHGDPAEGFFLSLYYPTELPW